MGRGAGRQGRNGGGTEASGRGQGRRSKYTGAGAQGRVGGTRGVGVGTQGYNRVGAVGRWGGCMRAGAQGQVHGVGRRAGRMGLDLNQEVQAARFATASRL